MKKFEVIPGNPLLQAKYEIKKLSEELGCEFNIYADETTKIRFQLCAPDGCALTREDHQDFIEQLLIRCSALETQQVKLLKQPGGSINIVIDISDPDQV